MDCFRLSSPSSYMCSSLKILNIAASAVGLRQAVGRVLSRIQISHGQAEERLHFFNGDIQSVCKLLLWLSIARMEIDYSLENGHFVTLLLILCK